MSICVEMVDSRAIFSNLRYYDHALSVAEINTIVYFGPNLKSANNANNSSTDFLSQSWYQRYT